MGRKEYDDVIVSVEIMQRYEGSRMRLDSVHAATLPLCELLAECDIRRGRRSGPGGQHRNKVETAIVVTHRPTGIRAEATERRSQEQNRRMALFRLRVNLALRQRLPLRAGYSPSDLWQSRCIGGRIQVSATHDDFPAVLAEALDVLAAHRMNLNEAAGILGCSTSQLVKFLKLEPRALELVNAARRETGLRPLQ